MTRRSFERLTPADVGPWRTAHPQALVLDARDPANHAQGHLAGALRLDGRNHEPLLMHEARDRAVFVYCYHGNASQTYAQMFVDFGFTTVADLAGGWEAWQRASSTTVDAHGNSALMQAAWRGHGAAVEALLLQGASLTAVNGDGNNALWMACVSNQPALVRRLADAGVPIDHQNATGATCLMYAASSGKPAIVQTLLALGANPHVATQDDFTALDMAADVQSLRLLREAVRKPLSTAPEPTPRP